MAQYGCSYEDRLCNIYAEYLNQCDLRFKKTDYSFKTFLTENVEHNIHSIISVDSVLATYLVLQVLDEVGITPDKKIFMSEDVLFRHGAEVVQLFKYSVTRNVLVIDGRDHLEADVWSRIDVATEVQKIVKGNKNKKILLIDSRESNRLGNINDRKSELLSDINVPERFTETLFLKFEGLTDDSKQPILQKEILFQGKTVKIQDVFTETMLTKLDILKMMLKDELKYGNELDVSESTYLHQLVTRHTRLTKAVLNKPEDIFVISTEDKSNLLLKFSGWKRYEDVNSEYPSRLILLDRSKAQNQFEELQHKEGYKGNNIHCLHYDGQWFTWKRSSGDPNVLNKYLKRKEAPIYSSFDDEEKLIESNSKGELIVVSGKRGSGKSAMLRNLAAKLKDKAPAYLVLHVDLLSSVEVLRRVRWHCPAVDCWNREKFLHFFVFKVLKLNDKLELNSEDLSLMLDLIKISKAYLLFDNFSELNEEIRTVVMYMWKALKQYNLEHMIIAVIPDTLGELKDNFTVYDIEPLVGERQVEALITFLKDRIHFTKNVYYKVYAEEVLSQFEIDDPLKEMPFILKTLAKKYKNPLELNYFNKVPSKVNIYNLLKNSLEKQKKYLRKKHKTEMEFNEMINDFVSLTLFKMIEAKILYSQVSPEFKSKSFKISENMKQLDKSKLPKIESLMFRQFLISQLIYPVMENQAINQLIFKSLLTTPEFQMIRKIVDDRIDLIPLELLHSLEVDYAFAIKEVVEEAKRSAPRTNFLHRAAQEGMVNIIKFVAFCLKQNLREFRDVLFLDLRNEYGETVLHLAATSSNPGALQEVLRWNTMVNVASGKQKTPLHYAIENDNAESVELLLQYSADVNIKCVSNVTPLELAVDTGNVKILKKIHERNRNHKWDETLLHRAVEKGRFETVQFLIENKLGSADIEDDRGLTPRLLAENNPEIKAYFDKNP